ncbi:MAG TPA: type I polyketide synthase, partial [Pyrinomonadaceae bacterium]
HFEQPNPKIDFDNSPFFVNARLRPWERGETPRRAGVSAFGIGGTNAHVVLEEAPAAEASGDSRPWQLLVLSARTATALEASTRNLAAHLRESPGVNLADVAYTLQVGRKVFDHRRALVCRGAADAAEALERGDRGRVLGGVRKQAPRPVVFMFPGQGAQYVNMGAGLYRHEETFRAELDGCAEVLRGHLGFDLRDALYPAPGAEEEAGRRLAQTAVTQPALFAVEYALARVWLKWGVRPAALIGHSVGEYVAACLSGVFSPEDGLVLVAARGRLMQRLPEGAMLSVQLAEADVRPLLGARLSLAAVNGAALCVVSGPGEAVAELEEALRARRVGCRRLRTSHAFHSDMMEPVLDEFTALVEGVSLRAPRLPFVSNLSGRLATEAEVTDPRYWARQLRQTVRAADGLAELLTEPEQLFLEVGPGQTLTTLVKHHPSKAEGHAVVNSLPPAPGGQPEEEFLARALGQLWVAGVAIDWRGFYDGERRRRLQLPTYPFEHQRYWVGRSEQAAPPTAAAPRPAAAEPSPAGGRRKEAAAAAAPRQTRRPAAQPDEAGPPPPGAPAQAGDGNGHGPDGATAPPEVRERIIARQLEVMSRQLELLRRKRLP